MPLDEFKTQILLLHSEQSTLDSLSSGFTDSYTVHCATSGSDALNTLGDTPINIIVSAQDLPGMSGLEALREAKKRSPDMIGILLAGHADDGLEALVGDKEVFQVVRGNITADALLKLVENATQQMRLMTLAESANDNAADVEDSTDEHIIMETSQDGATIISDGSGQIRALNPAAELVVESVVGSRAVDLLVLTKDQDFLSTIKESSRGTHTVHYATTLSQATETIREHQVGVAVVDAGMVGDKIEQLTVHLRRASPRLVAIVAGRRDDGEMLMDLINRGKVYRFLLKPVSPGRARLAIESSVKHHLESPDAAFKIKGDAPVRQSSPVPKAEPKPEAKSEPAPQPRPDAKPQPQPERPSHQAINESQSTMAIDPPLHASNDVGNGSSATELMGSAQQRRSSDDDAGMPVGQASKSIWVPAAAVVAIIVIAGSLLWFTREPDIAVSPDTAITNQQAIGDEAEADEISPVVEAPATGQNSGDLELNVDESLAAAESALLESRLEDASAALQNVRSTNPDNPRLPFLTSQLSQMQLRAHLADARLAIREQRFDDADIAIAEAGALGITEDTEFDAVADELRQARSEQRADDVLAKANARVEDGDLLSPPNDNARYYYELALADDADNAAARQGLVVIASRLALQARTEIDDRNLDAAEKLLGTATELDPANSDLAAAIDALSTRRDELAAERRRATANRRAREEAAATARQKEAAAAAAAAKAPVQEPEKVPEEAPEKAAVELPAQAPPTVADNDAETETATSDITANAILDPRPTAVSSLKRIKYVAPKYPRAAQRRNLSGWVDVVFTVDKDGTVKDVVAQNSEPGETFVNAATRAVEKWLFEPVVQDGVAVEKRVGVRMMFALE